MSFKNADKKYVDRHTDQSKATADRLERGAERVTRREGKQEIAAQLTPVCANCGQWQHPPSWDCMNECAKRGFAQYAKIGGST